MSDSKAIEKTMPARREKIRVRVEKIRKSRQHSTLGLAEIIGLGTSALMLLIVFFAYFSFLTPARTRLANLQIERGQLETRLRNAKMSIQENNDTKASVTQITESLQRFENERLASPGEGRQAIYEELNGIIKRNNVRNTSGPSYSSLDALNPNAPQQGATTTTTKSSAAKWQSIFPGLGVSVTVEGPYANVRHFLRDIEASNQFIVINAVELEGVSDSSAPLTPGASRTSLVSLHLDMAAYFRRSVAEQPAEQSPQASR
jgi:Tfp pilus assembly protein PilO